MKIHNIEELEEYGTLKFDDIVVFTIKDEKIEYIVQNGYCVYENKYNDYIFEKLGIPRTEKNEFAKKYYGYNPKDGFASFWPECKISDYDALTRLVRALYLKIEKSENWRKVEGIEIIKETNRIQSRFEILDIR